MIIIVYDRTKIGADAIFEMVQTSNYPTQNISVLRQKVL